MCLKNGKFFNILVRARKFS